MSRRSEVFDRVLLQDGCQARPAVLLTKCDAVVDDESRFLLHLAYILEAQTPRSLTDLAGRVDGGAADEIATPRGTVCFESRRIAVWPASGGCLSVSPARFAELVGGWRAELERWLAEGPAPDPAPQHRPAVFDDDDDTELERLEILAARRAVHAFRLRDGALTDSESEARADAATDPDRPGRRERLLGALLSTSSTVGTPTPARLQLVRHLRHSGELPSAIAETLVRSGRLDEEEWRLISGLRDLDLPVEVEVERWTIHVEIDEDEVEGPLAYVPLHHGAGASPVDLLHRMVDALVADGWEPCDIAALEGTDKERGGSPRRLELTRRRKPVAPPWS
ncbi:MAG: hypothetical protein MSC31_15280 [Solirubrobacteraceae bacterium MAG38_C4-C5]|nr:hypothetical protein [Candidatus Siliceabacter maunaloa]